MAPEEIKHATPEMVRGAYARIAEFEAALKRFRHLCKAAPDKISCARIANEIDYLIGLER